MVSVAMVRFGGGNIMVAVRLGAVDCLIIYRVLYEVNS